MKYLALFIAPAFLFCSVLVNAQNLTIYDGQETVGNNINSPSFEENPVMHPSGTKLFFTRVQHPTNVGGKGDKGDIWMSEQSASGDWLPAQNIGAPLNSDGLNAIIGFTDGGNLMYLSTDYKDKDGILRKAVATSRRNGSSWTAPERLNVKYFNNKSSHQSGWITADGTVLLLSIEAPGGYGTEDLYVCFRESDGSYSSPRNLGFMINTAFQENTPFLAEDYKTLIFASNGIAGQGGRDLFYSERLDDSWRNWSEPVSLGNKVNTVGTELSFSFRPGADFAYLTSTQNSEGYSDIKRVKIKSDIVAQRLDTIPQTPLIGAVVKPSVDPELVPTVTAPTVATTQVSGIVRDAKTLGTLSADIAVTGQTSDYNTNYQSGSDGTFSFALENGHSYALTVSSKGYLEEQLVAETFDGKEINETVLLQPLSVGNTVTLSHVLFEQSTANMIKGSEADLERVRKMMEDNPEVEILISGHTDNQGPIKPNIELSESRVQTVIDYLVSKGVDKSRLTGQGFGPTKPIASNASEDTRKLNRRVEFTVVKGN
ncbi:MAG: OmpA family protein [Imperialibacter sp.]